MDGFGKRLVEERERNGYNQKQFAELLGITPTRLNYWEKDKREPDFFMFSKIVTLLNADANKLLGVNFYDNVNEDITMFNQLDAEDKAEIRGEMKQMLKADKYKRSEDTKHKDNINSKEAALRNYIEHLSNSGTVAAYGGDGVKTVKGVTPEAMELIKKILDNS